MFCQSSNISLICGLLSSGTVVGERGVPQDMSTRHSMLCPLNSVEQMKVMESRFNWERRESTWESWGRIPLREMAPKCKKVEYEKQKWTTAILETNGVKQKIFFSGQNYTQFSLFFFSSCACWQRRTLFREAFPPARKYSQSRCKW